MLVCALDTVLIPAGSRYAFFGGRPPVKVPQTLFQLYRRVKGFCHACYDMYTLLCHGDMSDSVLQRTGNSLRCLGYQRKYRHW
jgi:hypothetical protein